MGDFARRNPVLAALFAVAVLLAVAVALEYVVMRPRADAGPLRRPPPAEARLLPPLVVAAPEQAYPETTARPLFTPTRRLAPEPASAQQQPAFVRGQFVLLGVTIARDTRIAMLREKTTGRIVRAARGAQVNGITLSTVDPESVTLTMGGEQEQLPLTVQKAGGAPGQPQTPGGPVPGSQPQAAAALQGPFGAAGGTAAAPATPGANAAPAPQSFPPIVNPPAGFAVPAFAGQNPPPGMPAPMPAAPQAGVPGQAADPNAGLSPEEILARRRARRAQQTQ